MNESNPEVGSSNKIQQGSDTSSIPIEVLFLSPPDSPLKMKPPIFVC